MRCHALRGRAHPCRAHANDAKRGCAHGGHLYNKREFNKGWKRPRRVPWLSSFPAPSRGLASLLNPTALSNPRLCHDGLLSTFLCVFMKGLSRTSFIVYLCSGFTCKRRTTRSFACIETELHRFSSIEYSPAVIFRNRSTSDASSVYTTLMIGQDEGARGSERRQKQVWEHHRIGSRAANSPNGARPLKSMNKITPVLQQSTAFVYWSPPELRISGATY